MQRIKPSEWFVLIVLAICGLLLWQHLALPRYQSLDLAVNQAQAVSIAQNFLETRHIDAKSYHAAAMFDVDDSTDRYMQKTLGVQASQQVVDQLHYDLFYWVVRFFKEKQKEEFKVIISSKTAQIIGFSHAIEDTASRGTIEQDQARAQAIAFLQSTFGFDPNAHTLHREEVKKFDNRKDYAFTWRANDVEIPWDVRYGGGSAKLLTTVTVSGLEIMAFNRTQFEIPDSFNRYIDNLKQTGDNLTLVFRLIFLSLLTIAIMAVVNRKSHIVLRVVKTFYMTLGILLFVLMILELFNTYHYFLFDYPTTQAFFDYMLNQLIQNLISPFFIIVAFILPALAGEALRYEVTPTSKAQSFLSPILSSFFTTPVAHQIIAGYAFAFFICGIQAVIFHLGYKYCGVWEELSWLTQSSTAIVPAFSAMLIGLHAAFSEEIMFRLFAINLLRRHGVNTVLAVIASALMWGFGHTGYAIFPMWFRGLEVTCLGIILGLVYLRFGLIATIATHYLMDAFYMSMPYLLRPQLSSEFLSSLIVMLLPLGLALTAFMLRASEEERALRIHFTPQQEFNCAILEELSRAKTPAEKAALKANLVKYGWDHAVIERLF